MIKKDLNMIKIAQNCSKFEFFKILKKIQKLLKLFFYKKCLKSSKFKQKLSKIEENHQKIIKNEFFKKLS